MICLAQYAISWESVTFELATAPRVFTALTKPILFLCCCKGFHIFIYLDDILVLVHSKQAGKRAFSFVAQAESLQLCYTNHPVVVIGIVCNVCIILNRC